MDTQFVSMKVWHSVVVVSRNSADDGLDYVMALRQ